MNKDKKIKFLKILNFVGLIILIIGILWYATIYFSYDFFGNLVGDENIAYHQVSSAGLLILAITIIVFGIGALLYAYTIEIKVSYFIILLTIFLISLITRIVSMSFHISSIKDISREAFLIAHRFSAISYFCLFIMFIVIFILIYKLPVTKRE